MTAADNKKLMQDVFAELAKANGGPFVSAMAADVRWTVKGTTKWSQTFEGRDVVVSKLLVPLGARMVNPTRVIADRFIAEDDLVVVEAHGDNMTKIGVAYNNSYCWIFKLAEGTIVEIIEYLDTELASKALGDPADIG